MLNAVLTYLAIDAVLSVITLGVAVYVFRKRSWYIRSMLRTWLGVDGRVIYYSEVRRSDFNEEGLYVGPRFDDVHSDGMGHENQPVFHDDDYAFDDLNGFDMTVTDNKPGKNNKGWSNGQV